MTNTTNTNNNSSTIFCAGIIGYTYVDEYTQCGRVRWGLPFGAQWPRHGQAGREHVPTRVARKREEGKKNHSQKNKAVNYVITLEGYTLRVKESGGRFVLQIKKGEDTRTLPVTKKPSGSYLQRIAQARAVVEAAAAELSA